MASKSHGPIRIGVTVDADGVDAGAKRAESALDGIGKSSEKTSDKVGLFGATSERVKGKTQDLADSLKSRLGPAGEAAGGAIDKAVGFIQRMPVAALGAAGAVAGLVTGLTALGKASIEAFGEAVGETQQLRAILGSTAEEASAFAEVFKEVGLSVDDTADVLENFGSLTREDLEEMEAMGVQLAENADGTVNYAGTLRNLLTEMAATTDQTKRAELGSKAFGEQWFRLKPLLDRGAVTINDLMDAAERGELGEIIGDDDIRRQQEFDTAIRSMKESFNDILVALGEHVLPIVTDAVENFAVFADGLDELNDKVPLLESAFKAAAGPLNVLTAGAGLLGRALGGKKKEVQENVDVTKEMEKADREAAKAAEEAAETQEQYEQVLKDLAEAEDRAREAHENRVNRSVELIVGIDTVKAAERELERSLIDQTTAQKDLDTAISEHGVESEKARIAALNLADAEDDVKQSVNNMAQAWADEQVRQREARGEIVTTDEKTDLLRQGFDHVASTLSPNSPLQAHISQVRGQLNEIPRHVPIRVTLEQAGISGQVAEIRRQMLDGLRIGGDRAMGGPAEGVVRLGERGPETVVLPSGSRVIPNHAGGGGSSPNITVNVRSNASPREIANEVAWALRFSGR